MPEPDDTLTRLFGGASDDEANDHEGPVIRAVAVRAAANATEVNR